jgi:hypothetical protein
MRNFIAVIAATITSFFMIAAIAFLMLRLDIKPFSDFAKGTATDDQVFGVAHNLLYLYTLILLPAIAFFSGLLAALLAKNKEYLIGLLCILPMFVIFFDFSSIYFVMVFAASALMLLGVRVAVYFKKKIVRTSPA